MRLNRQLDEKINKNDALKAIWKSHTLLVNGKKNYTMYMSKSV